MARTKRSEISSKNNFPNKRATPAGNFSPILTSHITKYGKTARSIAEFPVKQDKRATPVGNCSPILTSHITKYGKTARSIAEFPVKQDKRATPTGNCLPIAAFYTLKHEHREIFSSLGVFVSSIVLNIRHKSFDRSVLKAKFMRAVV